MLTLETVCYKHLQAQKHLSVIESDNLLSNQAECTTNYPKANINRNSSKLA